MGTEVRTSEFGCPRKLKKMLEGALLAMMVRVMWSLYGPYVHRITVSFTFRRFAKFADAGKLILEIAAPE
ncbi:MAG: hypothetical protein M3N97_14750 [Pseudomonadota bacterium]|nr:hypothetical protein [Pseudomonadota bacterium]